MTRRYTYPTSHAIGPYRLITFRRLSGYAIRDERAARRYVWTEPNPMTGRPIPRRYPLAEAIAKMTAAAVEDSRA